VESSQIILFNQKPISITVLSDLLKLKQQELALADRLPLVILKKGWDRIALLVEDIIGEKEIVIKPLNPPLISVPCVAGGTLLGTGEVIIVLNPSDLIHSALYSRMGRVPLNSDTLTDESVPHILLADDSITTRTLEKNILESHDYKVTVAVDGKEAWDLLQKQSFSLLITDIDMPNMNGFDLTERIKQNEKLHELPVIIVTSLDSDEQKKRGIEVGANAYIVKHDFESSELLEIVGQLV
jgi:two-component system chemotaxis sensor kinase CheA